MKRWMENKIGRMKAYDRLINGKSDRFAPTSKVAYACVPYALQPKAAPAQYDESKVRRIPMHHRTIKSYRTYGDDTRTWDRGTVVQGCYVTAQSRLIKAVR